MANEFTKAFKGIDAAIKRGTVSALNKALAQTKTQINRQIRQDTGLSKDVIDNRERFKKATKDDLSVVASLATKVGVQLGEFKPQTKTVNTPTGKRLGVTVKIGQQGRELVPGAWLFTASSGKAIVLARTGSGRYPVVALRSTAFADSAASHQAENALFLQTTFDRLIAHEIDFAIQSKFDSDR